MAKFRQNRHFCQIRRFRQIRQHFGALLAGFNLFALIISPTTFVLGKILLKSLLSPNSPLSPTLWGPFNWVNLFALIISSTTLATFRQNHHFVNFAVFAKFANISVPFYLGLIYSLLSFRQQAWRNFPKIATFAKFAVFAKFANISGHNNLCHWRNLAKIATFAKFAVFANILGPCELG